MVRSPQLLVMHPGTGVKTMQDLLRLAKDKGQNLAFATAGAATSSRLSSELFKQSAGVDFLLVSYKGGAPALNDLLGGQVAGMIASMSLVMPHVQRGRLTAVAVSAARRIPQLPDVPAIAETSSRVRGAILERHGGAGRHCAPDRRSDPWRAP